MGIFECTYEGLMKNNRRIVMKAKVDVLSGFLVERLLPDDIDPDSIESDFITFDSVSGQFKLRQVGGRRRLRNVVVVQIALGIPFDGPLDAADIDPSCNHWSSGRSGGLLAQPFESWRDRSCGCSRSSRDPGQRRSVEPDRCEDLGDCAIGLVCPTSDRRGVVSRNQTQNCKSAPTLRCLFTSCSWRRK